MNNEQKKNSKKLPGFYIALCCCVLSIGIAGYITDNSKNTNEYQVSHESDNFDNFNSASSDIALRAEDNSDEIDIHTEETVTASSGNVTEDYENESATISVTLPPQESFAVNNPDIDNSAITVSTDQPTFIMPIVNGDTLEEYSDKLKFNATLSDWRTHNGIDIAGNIGCSVQASSTGVIDEIGTNAMGDYVVISHSNGFVTRYMGLGGTEELTVGREIQAGEVIGTIGKCAGETISEPHIHFEISKDNSYVNPADYLPQE